MPSVRVCNSSSLVSVSSPFVTFPKTAYYMHFQWPIRLYQQYNYSRTMTAIDDFVWWSIHDSPYRISLETAKRSATCSSRWGADPRSMENEDVALSGSLYLHAQQHIHLESMTNSKIGLTWGEPAPTSSKLRKKITEEREQTINIKCWIAITPSKYFFKKSFDSSISTFHKKGLCGSCMIQTHARIQSHKEDQTLPGTEL